MSVIGRTDLIASTILTSSSDVVNSLEGIDTTGYVEGVECYVQENDGLYVLYPDDVQAPSPPTIVAATGGGNWILKESPTVSNFVIVSPDDTTPGDLEAKIAEGDGIDLTTLNPGGNEQLEIRGASETPRILWVDLNSTAIGTPEGSLARPFTTIQAAIDATDGTGNWQIMIAPGRYQPNGLNIPANRRIRFSGLGAVPNAQNEVNTNLTTISLLNPCTTNFAATDNTTNSDIIWEDLHFEFAGFAGDDTGNTATARHRVTFRNCIIDCPVVFNGLINGTNTILDLVFSGEGTGLIRSGGALDAPTYGGSPVAGSGTSAEVVVHGDSWHFSSISGVSRVDLRDCFVESSVAIDGPVQVISNTSESRALNTRFNLNVTMNVDMVMEVDAATMYWLERNGQTTSGGSFKLIDESAWTGQTTWFVDPSGGSDDNSGLTSGTALQTFAELQRRWGPRPRFTSTVTVTLLGDSAEPAVLRADLANGAELELVGSPTTVASGTVQTGQPWDYTVGGPPPAVGQDAQITETGGLDFFPYRVNRWGAPGDAFSLRWTNGPPSRAWVVDTVGVNTTARVTEWGFAPPGGEFPGYSTFDISAGHTFDVIRLTRLSSLTIDVQVIEYPSAPPGFGEGVIVRDLYIDGAGQSSCVNIVNSSGSGSSGTPVQNPDASPPLFYGCAFGDLGVIKGTGKSGAIFAACSLTRMEGMAAAAWGGSCAVGGGGNEALTLKACDFEISKGVLVLQGQATSKSLLRAMAGTVIRMSVANSVEAGLAAFSSGFAAGDRVIEIMEGSTLIQEGTGATKTGIWGGSNIDTGIKNRGQVYYENPIKLSGTVNDNLQMIGNGADAAVANAALPNQQTPSGVTMSQRSP